MGTNEEQAVVVIHGRENEELNLESGSQISEGHPDRRHFRSH